MKKLAKKNKRKVRHRIALKNFTLGGRVSTIIAAISLFILVWAIFIAYKAEGNAGIKVGVMGLISLILAICGFVFGIRSFYEKGTKFLKFTWIGTIMNMVVMVFYLCMLLVYFGGLI